MQLTSTVFLHAYNVLGAERWLEVCHWDARNVISDHSEA